MTPPVDLPNWIEQPVPDPQLTPIHDAIGKFVRATKAMEFWMSMVYAHFDCAPSYIAATKTPLGTQVARLAKHSHRLPVADRGEFERAIADADAIVDIRNAVVHGIGMPDIDETSWRTQRPDRKAKSEDAPWVTTDYNRPLLIGASLRAHAIARFFTLGIGRWFQEDDESTEEGVTECNSQAGS